MIGRQVKICTGFTQSIQILRRKKIKKIYCPMTDRTCLVISYQEEINNYPEYACGVM